MRPGLHEPASPSLSRLCRVLSGAGAAASRGLGTSGSRALVVHRWWPQSGPREPGLLAQSTWLWALEGTQLAGSQLRLGQVNAPP